MVEFGSRAESWLALIADVEGSRRVREREALQRRMAAALADCAAELPPGALAGGPEQTAGDEVQALLREPAAAVDLLTGLAERLFPVRLHAGLGWGPLATAAPPPPPGRIERVALADGPCLHRARGALELARERDAWAVARGLGEPADTVLSSQLELLGTLRDGWTDKQARYVLGARDALQKDVAERYGVSPSVVSESLKAAHLSAMLRGEEAARALLAAAARRRAEAGA